MSSAATSARADFDPPRWSDRSDEELLLGYRSGGSAEAFEELVHRYERELYSYLSRYLGDAALAEDVFQATFLQVHLKRDQFEAGRIFRPWLYTIATHQAIDAQRRNKRHRMLSLNGRGECEAAGDFADLIVSDEASAPVNMERDERREWVLRALQDLPEPFRRTVLLIYYQGMKYRDAAVAMGVPVGTVKSRMHGAVERLARAWKQAHSLER